MQRDQSSQAVGLTSFGLERMTQIAIQAAIWVVSFSGPPIADPKPTEAPVDRIVDRELN